MAGSWLDAVFVLLQGRSGVKNGKTVDSDVHEAFERVLRRFHVHVCRIVLKEGFEVNTRKSHFMRQGVRQQVAGIVLNVRPNLKRCDFDELKAILTNCVRHDPASQNRAGHTDFRQHLAGRIAHVALLNPARGARLRHLFEQVRWDAPS